MEAVMEDEIITCRQCENDFVFTVEEQRRYAERGFDAPRRCPECRKKKAKGNEGESVHKKQGKKKHGRWPDEDELEPR